MTTDTNIKRVEHFHKNKGKIDKVILSKTGKKEIIYGARAMNKRFPPFLDRQTTDFDIFTPTPKKDAQETERALDKSFGGNYFYVEPAKHPGTYKVKSRINKEGYADYTKPDKEIPSEKVGKHRYVKLSYVKKHIKKTLKGPEAKYRHDKDRDALNRIIIYERLRKARGKKRKPIKKTKSKKRKVSRRNTFLGTNIMGKLIGRRR